jgi:hypothetical protein
MMFTFLLNGNFDKVAVSNHHLSLVSVHSSLVFDSVGHFKCKDQFCFINLWKKSYTTDATADILLLESFLCYQQNMDSSARCLANKDQTKTFNIISKYLILVNFSRSIFKVIP